MCVNYQRKNIQKENDKVGYFCDWGSRLAVVLLRIIFFTLTKTQHWDSFFCTLKTENTSWHTCSISFCALVNTQFLSKYKCKILNIIRNVIFHTEKRVLKLLLWYFSQISAYKAHWKAQAETDRTGFQINQITRGSEQIQMNVPIRET